MKHDVLLDYELAVTQDNFIVRALVKLTGQLPDSGARIPLNLSLVLDKSGSMHGEKLSAASNAAAFLVRRLHPQDVVSVVAYDDGIETVALPATGDRQHDLPRQIEAITSGGSTNLSGGWLRGRELVDGGKRDKAMNRVILMTDGQANQGIVSPDALAGLCANARREGITTSTIGFGADYDERLLRSMADAGGGSTFYIEREDQAVGVFEEEIEGLLSLSAQNVAVEIQLASSVELVAIHHDYPLAEVGNGAKRVEIGDLYAREPRSLLVEFLVPALSGGAVVDIGTITIHAYVLLADGSVERQRIKLPIVGPLEAAGRQEPEVQREVVLAAAAQARREARRQRDEGDVHAARETLRAARARLAQHPDQTLQVREQVADLRAMEASIEEASPADLKYMGQRAYNMSRGKAMYEAKLSRAVAPPPKARPKRPKP
jgi:Ca-activated chloride channel family protein